MPPEQLASHQRGRGVAPPLSYPAAEPQLLTAPNSSATAATANPARLRQPATLASTAPSRFPTPDPPRLHAWTGDR